MGFSFLIISACLIFGIVAALASQRPELLPEIGKSLKDAREKTDVKSFSPRKTLFIIGPSAKHPACAMQRRLLRPALAALIREDVSVMEVYGNATPRKNGELMKWLDPSLLRLAMNAEDGFFIIYVDASGKTRFRNEAPMVTSDILQLSGLEILHGETPASDKSVVLKKLRAA